MTLEQWATRFQRVGDRAQGEVLRELTETSMLALRMARANATFRLRRRTGRLAASVTTNVTATADGAELRLLSGGGVVRHARLQDKGGTIRPRFARMLAIPIAAGLTAAGVPRWASPRDVPGGFWLRRPGRPPIFVRPAGRKIKGGGRARLDLIFVGAASVTVPASRFATDAMLDASMGLSGRIRNRFARLMEAA